MNDLDAPGGTVSLRSLAEDGRNSISHETTVNIVESEYIRTVEELTQYAFWKQTSKQGIRPLWSNQTGALTLAAGYLCADIGLPAEGGVPEAALIKMPTGTGKSGVIAVLSRCLSSVHKVLVLTPRTSLVTQMIADVRWRFWGRLKFNAAADTTFIADAGVAGRRMEPVKVERLLPSGSNAIGKSAHQSDRVVIIGTLTALDEIRRKASPSGSFARNEHRELLERLATFDLIIVDEAHYEPAPSWSRAVRELRRPTVLFSATPYRNDYKSFRVRGRFVFNYSLSGALDDRTIREVRFLSGPSKGKTDLARFVRLLQRHVGPVLRKARAYTSHPKLIVRADEFAKAKTVQSRILEAFGELPIVIHEQVEGSQPQARRFHSVDLARAWSGSETARFWIHQTKLLEGIDDPSFVAVGLYNPFTNARQLVQQLGRVLRTTDENRTRLQTAWVIALPKLDAKLRDSWDRYKLFEEYASQDPGRLVEAEAALPDRLLEKLPDMQYLAGEFRPKFSPETPVNAADLKIPASATIFQVDPRFDLLRAASDVEEALLADDRFKPVRINELPGKAVGFVYYGWRSSPYLSLQFFPEWTLGVCLLIQFDDLLFVNDTGGIVFDPEKLGMRRAERLLMHKLLPDDNETRRVRVNRMTTLSLDTSDRAIRSMSLRARSMQEVFDLLDPVMVPTTGAGYVNARARYVGFSRARLTDSFLEPIALPAYCEWAQRASRELDSTATQPHTVFGRYAKLRDRLTAKQAVPKSILLDFDGDLGEFPASDDDAPPTRETDAEYNDLCSEISAGKFTVTLANCKYDCSITFSEQTQRYKIESDGLDKAFPGESTDGAAATPITTIINREQAFRIIVAEKSVIYAARRFYEPNLNYIRADGTIPLLSNVTAIPALAQIDTEKGERIFRHRTRWRTESAFGVVHSICQARRPRAEWGDLYTGVRSFETVVCDDDGEEIGDFLAIDEAGKRVAIIHAKVGKGSLMSATDLQVVGRQVFSSLAFCSAVAREPKIRPGRWGTRVNANGIRLDLNRVFRNSRRYSVTTIESLAARALTDRSWNREVWILAGRLMSLAAVERAVRSDDSNRALQFLMYLESLITGCARGNSRLKVYCH
jgi:superfamily II DNA or RNA helicase